MQYVILIKQKRAVLLTVSNRNIR